MRVPLSWLRDYVDVTLTPEELAEQLTLRGMEVQGIEVTGADWTDVVVGRLLSVERHPDAGGRAGRDRAQRGRCWSGVVHPTSSTLVARRSVRTSTLPKASPPGLCCS